MELSKAQQRNLTRVWREFEERNAPYVVLRGYEDLPASIEGSDVDMLVDDDSFEDAAAYCKREFEPTESIPRNALRLASLVASNPDGVVRQLTTAPDDALAAAKRRLFSTNAAGRRYAERVFDADGLQLHLVNHLAYRSPMDGTQIRVDPAVERMMFDRRTEEGAFYVPAPPDELAHLVCRGVFDYDGDFSSRYTARCDALAEEVRSDSESNEQFRDVLSHIFYDADALVYDLVMAGDYDSIRTRLRRYSDY